ncbi:MAG: hypothetical protein ACD_30C00003G0013 [uncultured bacterium]|uniref:PolyA polymerase family protein n=4 Tax=Candidatus Daviesiibacteriota TaxID=1752718 RepID=A0A0G0H5S6_9BACT|nr:MAG: hypothetical protein ACD_30C00003G0013 [uncultured bacterium]KKQ07434.1 MAG: PolyA polymerase family protein [Candidatus Daviesbacteria bacterium GW2011_GWB1_36_5]OGE16620.1 MAG: hypothetical protein A2858_02125 [Candidatus Daviesbacteria bacterium RIFCSPHIGHO2_01_FULL_36_37]OGE33359.1 MAG: hypothetical protein A3C99_01555 [Candidatus Daviesbacteria bacterium RIFCSPHIGHO2_02_FULL_37_9]OGE34703.1 MAG: hypothetical protein A3E66_03685 [Candidatus Daviesbacteria bacterium RIFCSPHIGHO2_12_F
MILNLPKEVEEIMKKFVDSDYQIYIVGGAVRDLLMGREVKDWDFTTDAKPEEILKVIPEGFYNNKFGTVGISARSTSEVNQDENLAHTSEVSGAGLYEITTMRHEGDYTDHRHPVDVSWTDKIEEDLARRDFTVNAIALGKENKLVDPFEGQNDLEEKIIKAVGDPEKRFKEDALRLIRAIRFAAQLNFKIEDKTFAAIKENSSLIQKISWERIRDEFFKILSSENPYEGVLKLREVGLLQIILPELEDCFGIVQEGPKHDRVYDIGEHSLLSLKFCSSKDPLVRFACLIHDIGKVDTVKIAKDGNVTFYGHDVVGGNLAKKVGERLKLSKKEIEKLYRLVRWHLFSVDENQTDSAIRRFIKNVGLENIDDMMDLRVGDRLGGGTEKAVSWRMEKYKERIKQVLHKPFSISDLKVNGTDVMEILKIKPGPKVGEVLNKLFQEVLEDASKNNREYLMGRIKVI